MIDLIAHLETLSNKQRELDNYVIEKRGLTLPPRELYLNRVVAFSVELAEYANEVRAFKFWSGKECSREKSLEEYVDSLHFLLSITNQTSDMASEFDGKLTLARDETLGFDNPDLKDNVKHNLILLSCTASITEVFITMIMNHEVYGDNVNVAMNRMWNSFQDLGTISGFTTEEVLQAYDAKYQINIERQENGY